MDNCAEVIPEKSAPLKHTAFQILREGGLSILEAGKALEYKGNTPYAIEHKIKKASLVTPELFDIAVKGIKTLAQGKKLGRCAPTPPSVALAACKEIADRADPKITKSQNLNVNVDLSPVDLSMYANEPPPEHSIVVEPVKAATVEPSAKTDERGSKVRKPRMWPEGKRKDIPAPETPGGGA